MEGEHVGLIDLGNPEEFTMLELAQVTMKPFILVHAIGNYL
jgi:hypothetical protein